jgi:hypothetical protein
MWRMTKFWMILLTPGFSQVAKRARNPLNRFNGFSARRLPQTHSKPLKRLVQSSVGRGLV